MGDRFIPAKQFVAEQGRPVSLNEATKQDATSDVYHPE